MTHSVADRLFPLSPLQQGMLFHYLKEPHSGIDIEQLVVHLPEVIDHARMRSACEWLVHQHDALRARLSWEDVEQPRQEILDAVSLPFIFVDAQSDSPAKRDERFARLLQEDRLAGFDLSVAPLVRFTLFQRTSSSCSLIWTFHHALLDGRCFPILLRELFDAYSEGTNRTRSSPPASVYRQHIEGLHERDTDQASAFWKDYLESFRAPTPLVVDQKVSQIEYPQGELWEILDSNTTALLRNIAETNQLTMNSVFMGCWAILLHRYSGEEDVVFGATRACRKSAGNEAADAIGLYINTLPVRVRLTDDTSVLSVCSELRRDWLSFRSFEQTPLALIKSVSQIPPSQPLFESLLVFERFKLDTVMRSLGGSWTARRVELHELTNFPVTLAAYDGAELSLKMEFDRRRLADDAAKRMLGHLRTLMESLAAEPQRAVADLAMVNDRERLELLRAVNPGVLRRESSALPLDSGANLSKLFEERVKQTPDAIALTCDDKSLTYGEVNRLANRLAHRLSGFGIGADSLVGLSLERTNYLVVAILAILKAGGAYLPIDLAYPAERLKFIIEDAQATLLVTEKKLASAMPKTHAELICIEDGIREDGPASFDQDLSTASDLDNLAYVIYTSGTTGKPKGTLITHRNVVRLFSSTQHWFHFDQNDVWTLFHSTAFDFSVWEIWGALLYGGRLVVVPYLTSRSPEAFYELLVRERVTVLNQTPSAFRQLITAEEVAPSQTLSLRYVIFGGEALEMQSLKPWFDRHGDRQPQLVNMYGITETTVHVTYRPLSQRDLDSGSVIGSPIPDLQLYILDSRKRPVPLGIAGEMYVGGAGLARGYLRHPDLTAQKFVDDHLSSNPHGRLYRTGDLARLLPGNEIEYLGRIDDQVKIRGFRIELGEIEHVLRQLPEVREVCVMARENSPGAKQLVAYIVSSAAQPNLTELREVLRKKLPEYMVPAAFVFMAALPLTNNGKVDRKALPAPETERPQLADSFVGPRNAVEQKLTRIWSKVLRLERVGIDDNFFELGGDSILSIQIIANARREGLRLTPTQLFENQTIRELALGAVPIEKTQAVQENLSGEFALTPVQHWFFEQNLAEANHYNQAFLLEVSRPLNREWLTVALRAVQDHHDALRLRFARTNGVWRQFYSETDQPAPLEFVNLAKLPEKSYAEVIEKVSASAQASLDFANGPLWRVVYFDRGQGNSDRLFIVIHHLAVDGVSWRPLLEDLETGYSQMARSLRIALPAKTSSFKNWSESLQNYASSSDPQSELAYWKSLSEAVDNADKSSVAGRASLQSGLEGEAHMLVQMLSSEQTRRLLQTVPLTYQTQINDIFLSALALAWKQWSGHDALYAAMEGHGRENLLEEMDLSRTVGWFTSIFPVRLELPPASESDLQSAITHVATQLRAVPRKGVGFGILRYVAGNEILQTLAEPQILFNYLGQFDHVLGDSELFRFASEGTGTWHSVKQRRRYPIEINVLIMGECLEARWTFPTQSKVREPFEALAKEFLRILEELIEGHAVGGNVVAADQEVAHTGGDRDSPLHRGQDVEEICQLSPIQSLYFSANPARMHYGFDQWHCTLEGELDVESFRAAWRETVNRHSLLRASIRSERLREPQLFVAAKVDPPWTLQDWSKDPADQCEVQWERFRELERQQPLDLATAPVMRFSLIRLPANHWKFLWSIPALFLDGWSWPLVFRDVSRIYGALLDNRPPVLDPVAPYRDYLTWLRQQNPEASADFWRNMLHDFAIPTALPEKSSGKPKLAKSFSRHKILLDRETVDALQRTARDHRVTLNSVMQAAWAILLAQKHSPADVVYGTAFSGRPTNLDDAEFIVGPFVNTLPVRVTVDGQETVQNLVKKIHSSLLQIGAHQFSSLAEIQRNSKVPQRLRLFDSLVVFQNYQVDPDAKSFGGRVPVTDFVGPIHTNYPLLLLVEPGDEFKMTLIYDAVLFSDATMERWGQDLVRLLHVAPIDFGKPVTALQALLSVPVRTDADRLQRTTADQNFVPPQSDSELAIAAVWQELFDLDRVSVEENFFDLGGQSLMMLEMHRRLREKLYPELSIVTLFEHPTVRSFARFMGSPGTSPPETSSESRSRAKRQREALEKMRIRLKKTS